MHKTKGDQETVGQGKEKLDRPGIRIVGNEGNPVMSSCLFRDAHEKENGKDDQPAQSRGHQFRGQVSNVCHGDMFGQESSTQIPDIEHDKGEGGVEIIDHSIVMVVLTLMDTP